MTEEQLRSYLEQCKNEANPFEKVVQMWSVSRNIPYVNAYQEVREALDKAEMFFLTEELSVRMVGTPRAPIKFIGTFNECRDIYEKERTDKVNKLFG